MHHLTPYCLCKQPGTGGLRPNSCVQPPFGRNFDFLVFAFRPRLDSPECAKSQIMFSHVVIFWTDAAIRTAADELIDGANQYLKPIPGIMHFHIGRMVSSHRPVVDQSYQVGLNVIFADKKTQDEYQVHPLHVEFVEKVFKRVCKRVVVYDFEA